MRDDRTRRARCRRLPWPLPQLLPRIDCPFVSRSWASVRKPAAIVRLPVAHLVVSFHSHLNRTIGPLRRPRLRIVSQAVLRAKLAVNAIEYGVELRNVVRIEHGSAGAIGDSFQRVLAGGVSAILALHERNDDGLKQRLGSQRSAPRGFKIRATGGLTGVGD